MADLFSPEVEEEVISETEEEIREPSMYKVLLHNDHYTPMDFVVEILVVVFNKAVEIATQIMLSVHQNGIGVCGVYTYEIAETKVSMAEALSRERGFPLRCTIEAE